MEESLQLMLVMQDDAFQEILKNDKVLNDLESEKNDKKLQYYQIMAVISKKFIICGIETVVITPIMWSFLYTIDNKLVKDPENATVQDIDVFMYILANGIQVISDDLFEHSKDFCKNNKIHYIQAKGQILQAIHLAFRPLEMFPHTETNKADVRFNLDWLTRIVSLCCKMTNKSSDQVMFNMSLTEVLSYVIQACRQGDISDSIRRRNTDQVTQLMYKRTFELGKKYYQENYKNK